jgi:hypothetical protein
MDEGHLVASNAMTGGGLLTHPVRSNDLNDARARRRNDQPSKSPPLTAASARPVAGSVTGHRSGTGTTGPLTVVRQPRVTNYC